jgi:Icc-related predicted phosphoesterase
VAVYGADAVLVGGDLTGKAVVPLVRQGSGFTATFLGSDYAVDAGAEKDELIRRITDTGLYPYETDPDEMGALAVDRGAAEAIFDALMVARLETWADMAAEKLGGTVPIVIIPGNDDLESVDTVLEESPAFTMSQERAVDLFDDYQVVGIGYSNLTPWRAPRDRDEDFIARSIDTAVAGVRDFRRAIFMFHCPPEGTVLDECMAIDKDFRPIAGGTRTTHAGSTAVREAVARYQPALGLHGHIHESRGMARIGAAVCLNAGSEYSEGILRAAIVQLQSNGKIGYLFVGV